MEAANDLLKESTGEDEIQWLRLERAVFRMKYHLKVDSQTISRSHQITHRLLGRLIDLNLELQDYVRAQASLSCYWTAVAVR